MYLVIYILLSCLNIIGFEVAVKRKSLDENSPRNIIEITETTFSSLDTDYVDLVTQHRPKEINYWIDALQNKEVLSQAPTRRLLLIGQTGVGKTALAAAIPAKANVKQKLINCCFIGNMFKNSGQNKIIAEFSSIMNTQEPIVIILNDLECIFERFYNKNFEDQQTTLALIQMLDTCNQNPNILFIATVNSINNMPDILKSRLDSSIVHLSLPDQNARLQIFKHFLKAKDHTLSDTYINYLAKITNGLCHRQIKHFVGAIFRQAYIDSNYADNIKITQKDCLLDKRITK